MAEALYRKYRPQIFEDVVGQEHIERTIKNAIEQDKVSHAYLFTGPRGTGKTTTARLLAKALLCGKGPTSEPDGTCEDCEMIAAGEHPDVYELDAASRTGVENVREEIIGRVQFAPTRGRYKIYIIDEVHMLSTAAFNALLKTLEEPPSHVVFVLATTDPQKVPETIHSRCQRFDFRRISSESIVSRLGAICVSEGVEFEGDALELVAHRADGGMRNALTSLEQLIAFGEGKVTMEVAERMLGALDASDLTEIVRFVGMRDVAACFRWTAEYAESGADLAQFTRDFAEHMRNMYVMSLAGTDVALDVSSAVRRELSGELPLFGPDRLARMLGVLGDLSAELKTSTNPRLSFEIALTRMVRPDSDLTLESLAERVEALESGYSAVAHVVSSAPAGVGEPVPSGIAAPSASAVAPAASSSAPVAATSPSPSSAPLSDAAGSSFSAPAAEPAVACASAGDAFSASAGAPEARSPQAQTQAQPQPQAQPQVQAVPVASSEATASGAQMTAAVADSLRNPAALQRTWQAALAQLKKTKTAYGVLFLNTKAAFDEATATLVVEFAAGNDFAFRAVQKPDVQNELGVALQQVCGAPVPFKLTKAGAPASSTAAVSAGGMAAASAPGGDARSRPAGSGAASDGAGSPFAHGAVSSVAGEAVAARRDSLAAFASPSPASGSSGVSASASLAPSSPSGPGHSFSSGGYDEVPVDVYEGMAPYEGSAYDDPGYYSDLAGEKVPAPASPAPSATASSSRSEAPCQANGGSFAEGRAAQPAGGAAGPTGGAAVPSGSASAAPSDFDLGEVLAYGFGEGVEVEEVTE